MLHKPIAWICWNWSDWSSGRFHTPSHCPPPPTVSILSLLPFVPPFLNQTAASLPAPFPPVLIYMYVQYINVGATGRLFHPGAPSRPTTCWRMILFQICHEPLQFNLRVESRSSKIDVYEMKDERRNERADKSPRRGWFCNGAEKPAGVYSGHLLLFQQSFVLDRLFSQQPLSLRLRWAGVNARKTMITDAAAD